MEAILNTRLLGSIGEAAAAEYLRRKNYRIVAMNYRTRFGEIDIIATDKCNLLFVEVKSRKSKSFAEAHEYVDRRKQRKIINTAELWLNENGTELQPRFDVIEVYIKGEDNTIKEINHIIDAFE